MSLRQTKNVARYSGMPLYAAVLHLYGLGGLRQEHYMSLGLKA